MCRITSVQYTVYEDICEEYEGEMLIVLKGSSVQGSSSPTPLVLLAHLLHAEVEQKKKKQSWGRDIRNIRMKERERNPYVKTLVG